MGGDFGNDPFMSLHRDVNRLFDDLFRGTGQPPTSSKREGAGGGMLMPQMDVSETERELKICAELPGVSENDVDIRLEDDVLVIRAEKKFERKDEKENYHFVERSYGTFQRALRLPGQVNPDQVQARFENGVLTVTVPKSEQTERSRRIQIQGGARGSEASRTQGEPSNTTAKTPTEKGGKEE
jgi:HSP20 family protein